MCVCVCVCGDKGRNNIQNAKISPVSRVAVCQYSMLQIDLFTYAVPDVKIARTEFIGKCRCHLLKD